MAVKGVLSHSVFMLWTGRVAGWKSAEYKQTNMEAKCYEGK